MSKINHDLRSNHGRTIYMPEYFEGELGWGNLAIPAIYAADDAAALYPRGTRFVAGERVFYYGTYLGVVAAAGTTVSSTAGDDLAFKFLFHNVIQTDMSNALLIRKVANEQHIVYNTTPTVGRFEDFYSGGWVTGKDTTPADERMFSRLIVKHTYGAYGSATQQIWNASTHSYTEADLSAYQFCSVLELDQPVINTKTGMATTLMQNLWKRIIWFEEDSDASSRGGVAGACMHNDPTVNRHCWFQTHGPMFSPHLEYAFGGAGNETVILKSDGSLSARNSSSGTYDRLDDHHPIIGYVLADPRFESGSFQEESLPMLYVTLHR